MLSSRAVVRSEACSRQIGMESPLEQFSQTHDRVHYTFKLHHLRSVRRSLTATWYLFLGSLWLRAGEHSCVHAQTVLLICIKVTISSPCNRNTGKVQRPRKFATPACLESPPCQLNSHRGPHAPCRRIISRSSCELFADHFVPEANKFFISSKYQKEATSSSTSSSLPCGL